MMTGKEVETLMAKIYTIAEYCETEKISRTTLNQEWRKGIGVEFYRRGRRIYVTEEARQAYRAKLALQTAEERAK
jgi:hypothetical protein